MVGGDDYGVDVFVGVVYYRRVVDEVCGCLDWCGCDGYLVVWVGVV